MRRPKAFRVRVGGGMFDCGQAAPINPPVKTFKMHRWKILASNLRHSGNPHRLEVLTGINLNSPVEWAVREVDHHQEFGFLVRALEGNQAAFV